MAASISDKLTAVRSGTSNAPVTTVATARSIGGTSLACNDLTGWPTDTAIHFQTFKKKADGTKDFTTAIDMKGIVSGNTIGSIVIENGTDAPNNVDDFVEMVPTGAYAQDLYDGLSQTLNNDGTLQNNIVTTTKIGDGAVTTTKIADGAVTSVKLSTATGELGGAWQTWVPTFVNFTLGNGTVAAYYTQVGKTVRFRIKVTLGSTSSVTGQFTMTLPTVSSPNIYNAQFPIGNGFIVSGTVNTPAATLWQSTTTFDVRGLRSDAVFLGYQFNDSTHPGTWASGNYFYAEGAYEAA